MRPDRGRNTQIEQKTCIKNSTTSILVVRYAYETNTEINYVLKKLYVAMNVKRRLLRLLQVHQQWHGLSGKSHAGKAVNSDRVKRHLSRLKLMC